MANIKIINTIESSITVAGVDAKTGEVVQVVLAGAVAEGEVDIRLTPTASDIDGDFWAERVKNVPSLKAHVDSGALRRA